jgi:hypothetical protein
VKPLLLLLGCLLAAGRAQAQGNPFFAPDAATRAQAAREAGARRDPAKVSALVFLLRDSDAAVRLEAVRALAHIGGPEPLRHLKVMAQIDFDPRVRRAAARAVLRRDPRGYAATLASANPSPVAPVVPPPRAAAPRLVIATAALALNALRAADSFVGAAGIGLRWPYVEAQTSLAFPALSWLGQVRASFVAVGPLLPYAAAGFAVAFNNGVELPSGPAVSLHAGAGLRVSLPLGFFLYAEALPSWIAAQPRPPRDDRPDTRGRYEERRFALPVIVGGGAAWWP